MKTPQEITDICDRAVSYLKTLEELVGLDIEAVVNMREALQDEELLSYSKPIQHLRDKLSDLDLIIDSLNFSLRKEVSSRGFKKTKKVIAATPMEGAKAANLTETVQTINDPQEIKRIIEQLQKRFEAKKET